LKKILLLEGAFVIGGILMIAGVSSLGSYGSIAEKISLSGRFGKILQLMIVHSIQPVWNATAT